MTVKTVAEYPTFRSSAALIAKNGYAVVPLERDKKKPIMNGWPNYRYKPGDENNYPADAGIGVLTGMVVGGDIDVRVEAIAKQIEAEFEKMLGAAPKRIGAAPKSLRMYRAEASAFDKKQTKEYRLPGDSPGDKGHKVEFIANHLQFVAFGIHPDTKKPYEWNGHGDPLTVPVTDLPTISDRQAFDLITKADKILLEHGGVPVGKLAQEDSNRPHQSNDKLLADDPKQLHEALSFINNEELSFDDWTQVGLAIKGALGDAGREVFLEWSALAAKNDPKQSEKAWKSFKPKNIGAGSIYHWATQAGWARTTSSILLKAGKLHEAVDASIQVLGQHAEEIRLFQRGDFLVSPTLVKGFGFADADGSRPVTHSLRFKRLSATNIRIQLSRITSYAKYVPHKDEFKLVVADCPKDIAQAVYEENHKWEGIPAIESLSETPVFDGRTLYCGPGVRAGVYVNAPHIDLPSPLTKEVAMAALLRCEGWCDEFAYTDEALDGAALLAFLMTAALRWSLDTAPGFAITKHTFGAGATTAAKMASIIATGREPSVMPCNDEKELEKQMVSSLIGGDTVRILDNLPDGMELQSKLLTLSLSEPLVKVRVLGESREVVCPTTALTAITGVNIQTAADLNRRFIRVRLDPKMSAPETREFKRKNVIAMLARERAAVLRDLFTITAAYIASGESANTGDLSGYGQWVRYVAQPLVWLGRENVLRTVRAATIADPTVAMLRRVIPLLEEMVKNFGVQAGGITVSEMITVPEFDAKQPVDGAARTASKLCASTREALCHALGEATAAKQFNGQWQLDTRRIGAWLKQHHGRFVSDGKGEQRITKGRMKNGVQAWAVERQP
jgi:putative DNA primase/helicase